MTRLIGRLRAGRLGRVALANLFSLMEGPPAKVGVALGAGSFQAVKERAGVRDFSGCVGAAVERQIERDLLEEALQRNEAEAGPIPQAMQNEAAEMFREAKAAPEQHVRPEPAVDRVGWYGVRCLIHFAEGADQLYEESITVWRAVSFEEAIGKAEAAARDYAEACEGDYTGLAQAFFIGDEETIDEGTEVFSLMRDSPLEPGDYLTRFFDTGDERQGQADGPEPS